MIFRVKIVKDTKHYKAGETVYLSPNEAFGLLDSGFAVLTRDVVSTDYNTKVQQTASKRARKTK